MKSKVLVVVLLTSFLLVFGFTRDTASLESKLINIGWTGGSNWSALPYQVAVDRKFFEKEGLNVRLITMRGTTLMLSALMADEIDYHDPALHCWRCGAWPSREDRCIGGEIERLCDYLQPGN